MVAPRSLFFACLFATASASAAPLSCQLQDPAGKYLVDVRVEQPPTDSFDPVSAQIILRDKVSGDVLQTIATPDASELLKTDGADPTLRCDEQRLLVFDDFNFDGQQDLAVRNGNDGGYAAASYDIYLFDAANPLLMPNKAFSALTREPNLGMFEIDSAGKRLITRSKSGCCWRQRASWQVQDQRPLRVAETIEVAQAPSEANPFMPKGYTEITQRNLQGGQWVEQRRFEGPTGEAPVMLRGKLDGKIAFQLWWQLQGAVYIGEVRYSGGSGKPIRLVGEPYDDGGIALHEISEQGTITGNWFIDGEPDENGFQGGTWHSGDNSYSVESRPTGFHIAPQKLAAVAADQREGRYVMVTDDQRSAWLTLKITRDPQGSEVASLQMAVTQPDKPAGQVNEQWPLLAGNLLIAQKQVTEPLYRVRLLDGAVWVEAYGEYDAFRGTYLKQP
ncbi:XAC2610-related protein [Pseudomonas sp. NPDC087817]|uniref:XAC2610-related protein n=1 Tax=Pseudomonas sp. NPDC087817 TaxID=3364451 RepID=UPI00381B29D4